MSHGNKPLERLNDICTRLETIYHDQLDELNGYKKVSYFVVLNHELQFRKYGDYVGYILMKLPEIRKYSNKQLMDELNKRFQPLLDEMLLEQL